VECTEGDATACTGDRPVCEDTACRACLEHDECASGACNLLTGACFTGALELWVDDDAAGGGDGSMGMPFQEIREATTSLIAGDTGIVHVAPGQYLESVAIKAQTVVAILTDPGDGSSIDVDNALDVDTDGTVFWQFGGLSGEASRAVRCIGGTAWIDDAVVSQSTNLGVDATDCTVVLRRSSVDSNDAGGIRAVGGTLRVENGFVTRNGGFSSAVAGIGVDGTEVEILYSTVAENNSTNTWDSIGCANTVSGSVRNSVVGSPAKDDSIGAACSDLVMTYSVVEEQMVMGQGNVDWTWNAADFVDPGMGDYHAAAGGAFEDVALWVEGDPDHDVDGDARPEGMDYAGADVP
jgi:hypothetical protein